MTLRSSANAPPGPPGSLVAPPATPEVLAYLKALASWTAALRRDLDALDAAAQVAHDPNAHTADVTLAMSLWSSIDVRRTQLVSAWDSGRVGPDELARIATLLWGRLPDALGNPSAFTLPEACTLSAALLDRLRADLAADPVAGSGTASRVAPVRDAIDRCRAQAAILSAPSTRIDQLSSELESVVAGTDPEAIAGAVGRIDAEITGLERDLIKEAGSRATLAARVAALRQQYSELATLADSVHEIADDCRAKIAGAPRLAVPSVLALGEPREPPAANGPSEWQAARDELDQYATKLARCASALAEAQRVYSAPLNEQGDLRGLLGAYRDRAARHGLAEDGALSERYDAAHDVLWSAPCDLATARTLVGEYQTAVRRAVGADTAVELPTLSSRDESHSETDDNVSHHGAKEQR
jgi:hypothetical protein